MKISPLNYSYQAYRPTFKSSNWVSGTKDRILIHETAFFREPETDEFVKNYLVDNFLSKNCPINMLIGACSSGEEVYTQAMLYDDFKDMVDITGFDISNEAVEIAKEGLYRINKNHLNRSTEDSCLYKDSYLAFNEPLLMSRRQKRYLEYFREYFCDFSTGATNSKLESKNETPAYCREKKFFALKKGKAQNCKFKQGNILDLSPFYQNKKNHVIFFRNAMYHLVCDFALGGTSRGSKKNSEETIRKIAQEMNKSLICGGLVVFGEKEKQEGVDTKAVYEIMKEEGFEPLNTVYRLESERRKHPYDYTFQEDEYTNVWRKIR